MIDIIKDWIIYAQVSPLSSIVHGIHISDNQDKLFGFFEEQKETRSAITAVLNLYIDDKLFDVTEKGHGHVAPFYLSEATDSIKYQGLVEGNLFTLEEAKKRGFEPPSDFDPVLFAISHDFEKPAFNLEKAVSKYNMVRYDP